MQAAFQRWRAAAKRVPAASKLPEPRLSLGYFLSSVETRVGPQQARVSLEQSFPWPTELSAGHDAAARAVRAAQRAFEAETVAATARAGVAYWTLWETRVARIAHVAHLGVLEGLVESVEGRVKVGSASLADQQQIALAAGRLEDRIQGMRARERGAAAELRAALGWPRDRAVPTEPTLELGLPIEGAEALVASAQLHPRIAQASELAESAEARARSEDARRWPGFTVGADWIVVGDGPSGVEDRGKDALAVGLGLKLPLWQSIYADAVEAAHADAQSYRFEARARAADVAAGVEAALAEVEDQLRRVQLYRDLLIPQAEAVVESAVGGYAVGRGSIAQLLLAQEDLLELRIAHDAALAGYERAFVRLEAAVGRPVPRAFEPRPAPADGELETP